MKTSLLYESWTGYQFSFSKAVSRAGARYIDFKLPVLFVNIVAKLFIWLKKAGSMIFTIPSLSM